MTHWWLTRIFYACILLHASLFLDSAAVYGLLHHFSSLNVHASKSSVHAVVAIPTMLRSCVLLAQQLEPNDHELPNQSIGCADTNMDQPEDGQESAELAADSPVADETEKEDESLAAANAIDQVVVRAIVDRESTSTAERPEVMTALCAHQCLWILCP